MTADVPDPPVFRLARKEYKRRHAAGSIRTTKGVWIRIDIDFEPRARARSREGVPMLKTAAGALSGMLVTFGTGCANTVAAHRPLSEENLASVNDSLGGREARVTLAGVPPAEPLPAKDVEGGRHTTQWLPLPRGPQASQPRTVPTAALQRISIKRRDLGALVGLAVGANGGAAVGGIVAAAL